MSLPTLLLRTHSQCTTNLSRLLAHPHRASTFVSRKYATHRDQGHSSLLSQSLDTKEQLGSKSDSVGPFQLGLSASARSGEKVKKWSELSTGGKVLRTTARTSNITVILLGAGLSALLIYSLTSELFSKNSPTVLYNNACERIKASPRVKNYLNGPLIFHNNPPSVIRPRHRNRHVTSQIMVDAYGNEHMIMTFYVQGRPPGSAAASDEPSESSFLDSTTEWVQEKFAALSELTFDDSIAWTQERANSAWERAVRAFKYASGAPLPPPKLPSLPAQDVTEGERKEESAWNLGAVFGALKGSKGSMVEAAPKPDGRVWTDGEVHADFIRNNDGYFIFRYLLIDLPSSRDRNPTRVFVERSPGVRENEPVMRWRT